MFAVTICSGSSIESAASLRLLQRELACTGKIRVYHGPYNPPGRADGILSYAILNRKYMIEVPYDRIEKD
jgi:hypothetical protein